MRLVDHAGAYMSLVELVDAQLGLTAPLQGRIDLRETCGGDRTNVDRTPWKRGRTQCVMPLRMV